MSACVRCTAEGLLIRLRAMVRRQKLPTLSDLTETRGEAFETAYSALEETGYYTPPTRDTPKRRRACVDRAIKSLKE